MEHEQNIQAWYDEAFVPWKAAAAKYADLKNQHQQLFVKHIADVQSMIAMLLDGRNKQALLAWNTLGLQPKLTAIEVDQNREHIQLITDGGTQIHLKLDEVISDIQALLEEPA